MHGIFGKFVPGIVLQLGKSFDSDIKVLVVVLEEAVAVVVVFVAVVVDVVLGIFEVMQNVKAVSARSLRHMAEFAMYFADNPSMPVRVIHFSLMLSIVLSCSMYVNRVAAASLFGADWSAS